MLLFEKCLSRCFLAFRARQVDLINDNFRLCISLMLTTSYGKFRYFFLNLDFQVKSKIDQTMYYLNSYYLFCDNNSRYSKSPKSLLVFYHFLRVRCSKFVNPGNQLWSGASSFRGDHFLFYRDHFYLSGDR